MRYFLDDRVYPRQPHMVRVADPNGNGALGGPSGITLGSPGSPDQSCVVIRLIDEPGRPDRSYLYCKLVSGGQAMHRGRSSLSRGPGASNSPWARSAGACGGRMTTATAF